MGLSLFYDLEGCLVAGCVLTVPVNHGAFDAATDHVFNLAPYLYRIGRAVADIHVVRTAEPAD